jgi:hypothetical protein
MKALLRFGALLVMALMPAVRAEEEPVERLYRSFQDPPREYTIRPFWFWNGKLDAGEVEWQIEQMISQGVYGAYVHNRTGLETPYLSEEYFQVVKAGFEKARKLGFLFGFVDEYEWPSGEVRDIWEQGLPSRVIASNPDFRMRSLGYVEKEVQGPGQVEFEPAGQFQCALAARLLSEDVLDAETLTDISAGKTEKGLRWNAPAGRWLAMMFYLHPSQGRDGGLVDLLNAAAVRKFLDLDYEEYYRRFGEHFGGTIDSTFADHEGDYGYRIAWTPALFETFRRMKGYDLRGSLPLLMHDGGRRTPKVRCDYLDVISELYCQSFFEQVTEWCEAHRIKITGHVWEETLQMEAAFEGDLQRIMRAWSWPGVDSLWDKGRLPRDFKAAASAAHFRGTRFTCENQGLQGADSFLDFQKMRLGTNMIAAWGVNSFVPHAFNYNRQRIEYPPDWFYHEPYWKYFKYYADYARRLSYMNDGGRHVADILLFQPTESAWAHSEPAFSNKSGYIPSKYNNPLESINAYYTNIMNRLAQERRDYDVADSQFLREARLNGGRLEIGSESFRVLILPPVTTMRRETLAKVRAFFEEGGTVLGINLLPTASMDEGRDDPVIADHVRHIFGDAGQRSPQGNTSKAGGKAFFVKEDIEELLQLLDKNLYRDMQVIEGPKDNLFCLHRRKEGVDFYWVVNDSGGARDNTVRLAKGLRAEKWDASDARREPLYCSVHEGGLQVRLHFDPWEAYYVVLRHSDEPSTARLLKTNMERSILLSGDKDGLILRGSAPLSEAKSVYAELEEADGRKYRGSLELAESLPPIELNDGWQFTLESAGTDGRRSEIDSDPHAERRFKIPVVSYPMPYALMKEDLLGEGMQLGWHRIDFPAPDWRRTWLSRERLTIRDWHVIGPFPNEDHRGVMEPYPPEKAIDLKAVHKGSGGDISWKKWTAETYRVDLDQALGTPRSRNWVTAYALTYVYAPTPRKAQFRIVADNNAKLWVNGAKLLDLHIHPFYFEMREDFALTRTAELKQGWNEVLLKVSKCSGARQWAFMARVTDEAGRNFDDLTFSPDRMQNAPAHAGDTNGPSAGIWYRMIPPPGALAVQFPQFHSQVKVLWNGEQIRLDPSGEFFRFPHSADGKSDVLMLITRPDEVISDTPIFLIGRVANVNPGSWTAKGLPYFSGSAFYERQILIPRPYIGKKLILDCGQVGVVAELWVNDQRAGARVWLPYSFDISGLVRSGNNKLRILVTNTMENERAVENHAAKLQKIEPNGLIGPVRIVPYQDVDLRCAPLSGK